MMKNLFMNLRRILADLYCIIAGWLVLIDGALRRENHKFFLALQFKTKRNTVDWKASIYNANLVYVHTKPKDRMMWLKKGTVQPLLTWKSRLYYKILLLKGAFKTQLLVRRC